MDRDRPTRLAVIVLGLTAAIAVMVLAFTAPALNAGAEDLSLAVSGPGPAVEQFTATLEAQRPGTFDVTTHGSPIRQQTRSGIRKRSAVWS